MDNIRKSGTDTDTDEWTDRTSHGDDGPNLKMTSCRRAKIVLKIALNQGFEANIFRNKDTLHKDYYRAWNTLISVLKRLWGKDKNSRARRFVILR